MDKAYFEELMQAFARAKMTDPDYVDPIEAVSEDESLPDDRSSQGNPGTDYQEESNQTLDSTPLRTINTTSGSYITLACYRLSGATWSYWMGSQLYAGIQSGDQYFTVGTVNMDLLCQGLSCPKSFSKVTIRFTGNVNSSYTVWTNSGTELVYDISSTGALINGTRTSSNCIYEVPYDRILDMGYTDFSISLTQSGGFVAFDDSVTLVVEKKTTNVFYGTNAKQCFDVYIPSGYTYNAGSPTKYPAVVLLHGGGWTDGDKSNMIGNNYNYPTAITSRGCICVNMNYRLSTTCQNMLNDIQGVLDTLRTKHSDCILTTKAALWGYSAGGHLALLYAYHPNTATFPIKLVISEAGPTDLSAVLNYFHNYYDGEYQQEFLAGNETAFSMLTGSSPLSDSLLPYYSPSTYAASGGAVTRSLLAYSSEDVLVPSKTCVPTDASQEASLLSQLPAGSYTKADNITVDHESMIGILSNNYSSLLNNEINTYKNL